LPEEILRSKALKLAKFVYARIDAGLTAAGSEIFGNGDGEVV
jgi:hypothetical protein